MKTSWLTIVLLVFAASRIQGQVSPSGAPASAGRGTVTAQDTPFAVASKGANQQVWQCTTYETLPSGQMVPHIHKYTELATGLNFWDSNTKQWVESKEEIDILPNGTAVANQGQHTVTFPGDIYQGVIELVMTDGKHLQSRPLGLSYDDGTNTVLIAELRNSVGYLVGSNQVIFSDAFAGLNADVRYTYTKAGLEQDIILREQPLTPESYGLNPATTRLQALTEFFNPPQPAVTTMVLPKQAGIILTDENLDFGVMKMMPGRAFLLGSDAHEGGALVSKSWVKLEGRQFLVEEVPVEALVNELAQLPVPQAASIKPNASSTLHAVSVIRLLPAPSLTKTSPSGQFKQVAQAATLARGLVLDYVTMTAQTNYTFQGDTTYYISGAVNLYGTNTFEGGAVIKYTNNASINLQSTNLNWRASAYRPVVFTAKNDNSVGETISGSTGNPTNYYANPALSFPINSSLTLTNFRVAFARQAFSAGNGSTITLFDSQVVNCQQGLTFGCGALYLRNVLFSNVKTNFNYTDAASVYLQNCTFDTSVYLLTIATNSSDCTITADNSILANVTNLYAWLPTNHTFTGSYNGFYNSPSFGTSQSTNAFNPFQSVGVGNYYLASGCGFTNGTTNIDSTLLADIRTKTTYPPIVYANTNISVDTTFSPQARRDTNGNPDLGYHYDPLDYIVSNVTVSASLTLTNGVALGLMGSSASLTLQTNGNLFSQGTPLNLNRLAHCANVQEQPVNVGSGSLTQSSPGSGNYASFRFSDLSMRPGGIVAIFQQLRGVFSFQDSQLRGCFFMIIYGGGNRSLTFTNNLLERCTWASVSASGLFAAFYNNLFRGGSFTLAANNAAVPWYVRDNLFDQANLSGSSVGTNYIICSNNGFTAGTTNSLGGTSNKTSLVADYQSGPLGRYYYPTNGGNLSQLINAGSRNAASAGLYHYTTQTNQVKETNSVVDIGYHYVALNPQLSTLNPVDSNQDGVPDYLEDANGNGLVDAGETNWGLAILVQPVGQTVIQGTNAAFSVTAAGVPVLNYQWYFNSVALTNETGSTLTLYNIQTNDAGSYHVVVSNALGLVTSSNATLTVLVPPEITTQPTNQTVIHGTNVTFSVTVTGTAPLGYQWWFNGTNFLAEATNASLTLMNVQLTNAGSYSVVITNAAGSLTSSNAVLTVQVAIPMLAIGGERIMELTTNGDVVSWGGNQYGELGDYTSLDSTNPVHVVGLTNIIKIAAGLNHSFAIDANGALWAWGDNQLAQLGDGDLNATNQPVQVSGMTNSVVAVAGGSGSSSGDNQISVAVKADGTVWTWGSKYEGSDEIHTVIPTQVEGLTNAIAAAAGEQHALVLLDDGTVWAWGSDYFGQLTLGQVSGLSNIVAICAGDNHSLALDTNGCVWAWGLNESGQLGDGETTNSAIALPVMVFSNAVQIAAGANHSLALDNKSNVRAWGANNAGQLGTNGFGQTNFPMQILELTNIIAIAAGSDASVALDGNGNLWQWGAPDSDGANWVWSDENGLPELAPQYDDFYNGQLPNLMILNGTNQVSHADREFSQYLVCRVTDANGVALSNAPVSVEVIAGDMELRTISGGDNYKGLRLTTDTNGEVSLIGYADQDFSNPNCVVRVLAASREQFVETNFNETLIPPPTISITSPTDGSTYLIEMNQPLTITVDAEAAPGASIQEVDYYYGTNGTADTLLGVSTQSLYSFIWTNSLWWTNAFVGQYTLSAVAVDNMDAQSGRQSMTITIALDFDGSGMPDYWQLEYFGHLGVDPNAPNPSGNGLNNLQTFQQGAYPPDYYNGVLPNLEILAGNDQDGNYDSFLLLPVTIRVTDTNSFALANAPVVFTVINETAQVAATTNDTPVTSLALLTGTDGQVSAWVYFPPSSSNPPDSTIMVSATSGTNIVAIIVNESVPLRHWTFNDTNTWVGEEGQLPLLTNNLVGIPSWSSNAVLVDSSSPALLAYNVVEINGNTNLNCQTGSIRFWFEPDWSSVDQGGTGPGAYGRLIEMGSYNLAFTNGWWALYLSPDGTQLSFGTSTNGGGMTNLSANTSWVSNEWYQIALTYSPTGSALYVNAQLLANGAGVIYFPNADEQTNGFRIGSDQDGGNQAGGAFDELDTFNYPLNATNAATYSSGVPDWWEIEYFGRICVGYDPDGDGQSIWYDYQNGIYPNKISFSFSAPNQYVTTNVVSGVITILGGVPSSIAVLVDNTNFTGATWTNYTSSNITITLSTNQGPHDVWVGLRGLPTIAQPTWEETTIILDSIPLTIAITNPVDNASFNVSRVNISGYFTAASLKQISVNGILAFVNGTNFEARNVPLVPEANTITAVIEDLTGETNTASITIIGLTNLDGSMNNPLQLQATPVAGFAPLSVAFQITNYNAPGTLQQVLYDFNGNDITGFTTNNLSSVTYTYTNGEYFPVVTIQTDVGSFSSIGGWNSVSLDGSNQPIRINVQSPPIQTAMLTNFPNPVDLKWDGTHLFVLSGSGAAIYEFATNGNTIRSLGGIGTNPSGIDVDGAGNVYVAVTGSNQVWKFKPTESSFVADTNFGIGGCIGLTNGAAGNNTNEFNAPFDVAVTPDGQIISVSDSGNHRIQQFSAANGVYIASFGSYGSEVGQFKWPKGLTYDALGTLYIVDSDNNRIVLAQGSAVMDATGSGGNGLGQFASPLNISIGKRGVYVADTGNSRIQKFDLPAQGLFEITSGNMGYALSTNLSAPAAVAAVDNLTNEMFYVADTGNNRVILCRLPDSNADELQAIWNGMTNRVAAGDISGAVQYFSSLSADGYQQAFLCIGTAKLISDISQIGPLTPVYIENGKAEYYFEQTIGGQLLLFPVEFVKENGVWKISEF